MRSDEVCRWMNLYRVQLKDVSCAYLRLPFTSVLKLSSAIRVPYSFCSIDAKGSSAKVLRVGHDVL